MSGKKGKISIGVAITLLFAVFLFVRVGSGVETSNLYSGSLTSIYGVGFNLSKSYVDSSASAVLTDGNVTIKARLLTPHTVYVPAGYRKVAEFSIDTDTALTRPITGVQVYDKGSMAEIGRVVDYKWFNQTGERCTYDMAQTCSNPKDIKTCVYNNPDKQLCRPLGEWLPFDNLEQLPRGTIRIGLFMQVQKDDYLEWVPTIAGVRIGEWATVQEGVWKGTQRYYSFNESAGTSLPELTGYGINATNNDMDNTNWVAGKRGNALTYDGTTEYTAEGSLTLGVDYSVNLWMNPNSMTQEQYWGLYSSSGGPLVRHDQHITLPQYFRCVDGSVMSWVCDTFQNGNYSAGTWTMLTLTKNSTTASWYRNGVLVSGMTGSMNYNFGTFTPWIAQYEDSRWNFNGKIDEFGVWNRTLSDDEVLQLYNGGNGLSYGGFNNSVPTVPVWNKPDNNSLIQAASYFVNWTNSTDADGDALTYALEIDNNSSFSSLEYSNISIKETATPTGARISGLLDGVYYARVRANDGMENSNWSETRTFTQQNLVNITAEITPALAYANSQLNCIAKYYTTRLTNGIVAFKWYRNEAYQPAYDFTSYNVPTGTYTSGTLVTETLVKGDVWKCQANATDGTATNTSNTTVAILNSPPTIASYNASNATKNYTDIADVNFTENDTVTFAVQAQDADNDALWYRWVLEKVGLGTIYSNLTQIPLFSWFFDLFSSGNYLVNVTVNDTSNAVTGQAWNLAIANVVNRFWTVSYTAPTPDNNANLSVNSFNVSISVVPSVTEESSSVLIFHGNQSGFNGNYSSTYYNSTDNSMQLSYANLTGTYASQIVDAGRDAVWDNLSWNGLVLSDGELAAQQGLVALWHLNNDWLDSSGFGNVGAGFGGVGFTADARLGSHAGSFDGSSGYVVVPSVSGDEMDMRSGMSVSAWIRWVGPADPPSIYYPRIVEKDYASSWLFSLRPDDATRLSVWLQNGERASTLAGSVSLGQWHNVVFTFNDTSDEVRIYVDGRQNASGTYAGVLSGSASDVYIGRYPGSSVAYFNGSMDEVAVWNRTLTPEEVYDNYNKDAGSVKFQVRSCDDMLCSGELFAGPSGVNSYYANRTFSSLAALPGNRWVQYNAYFSTNNANSTPRLYNVTVKGHTPAVMSEANITTAWVVLNGNLTPMNGQGLSWSKLFSNLNYGSYNYTAHAQDQYGNTNYTALRTVTIPSYNITFNITSGENGQPLNNIQITCDYTGFDQSGNTTNPYGPFQFPTGNWQCEFVRANYYNKTQIFTADNNKIVDVVLEWRNQLTTQEHDWIRDMYDCMIGGDCAAYQYWKSTNENVSKIWQQYLPTDVSVVTQETFISKTLSTTQNITINYTLSIPYKDGYNNGDLLPIRIFYWFTDGTKCYNQDKQIDANNAANPYCVPLVATYLGPNNGTVTFTVDLRPNLPSGTYNITRQIDIDPLENGQQTWKTYGRELVGKITVVLEPKVDNSVKNIAKPGHTIAKALDSGIGAITGAATGTFKDINSITTLVALAMICLTMITISYFKYNKSKL